MTENQKLQQILDFIQTAEKLKTELRHSWTSNIRRQESVAEHTWLMSLIALLFIPEVKMKLDSLKVLKMVIIHDLVEVYAGDIPVHEESQRQQNKYQSEREALDKMLALLPNPSLAEEFNNLWEEFEALQSDEARFVKAMDTLEVITQHHNTSLETWSDKDFDWALSPIQDAHFNADPLLRNLKNHLNQLTVKKVTEGDQLHRINQDDLIKWQESQG